MSTGASNSEKKICLHEFGKIFGRIPNNFYKIWKKLQAHSNEI